MMTLLIAAATAALAQPSPASNESEAFNPQATALFERDPSLNAWAVAKFDRNGDGWLTSFEAQAALADFKGLADSNRDGRVTVSEFQAAKAFAVARSGAAPASGASEFREAR
jgi:hypothetical protein